VPSAARKIPVQSSPACPELDEILDAELEPGDVISFVANSMRPEDLRVITAGDCWIPDAAILGDPG